MPQEEQLEEVQEPQALPAPAMEEGSPDEPLEKAENREKSLRAGAWQRGQHASSPDSLKGRRSSNVRSQAGQLYS